MTLSDQRYAACRCFKSSSIFLLGSSFAALAVAAASPRNSSCTADSFDLCFFFFIDRNLTDGRDLLIFLITAFPLRCLFFLASGANCDSFNVKFFVWLDVVGDMAFCVSFIGVITESDSTAMISITVNSDGTTIPLLSLSSSVVSACDSSSSWSNATLTAFVSVANPIISVTLVETILVGGSSRVASLTVVSSSSPSPCKKTSDFASDPDTFSILLFPPCLMYDFFVLASAFVSLATANPRLPAAAIIVFLSNFSVDFPMDLICAGFSLLKISMMSSGGTWISSIPAFVLLTAECE
mmetsp:Transcript_9181/g.21035  ORF Transcript_9181/g.21035 Transcript_9181/m.21035 type:complete len:296 (-) Transcript_9181:70-957(-)